MINHVDDLTGSQCRLLDQEAIRFWERLYGPEGVPEGQEFLALWPTQREGLRRLLRLARYLKAKRPRVHRSFDFQRMTDGLGMWTHRQPLVIPNCGSAGCAIGELPGCFPRSFFIHNGVVVHRQRNTEGQRIGGIISTEQFFSVTRTEARHLFLPENQIPDMYGGDYLDHLATPSQVADNILAFVHMRRGRGRLPGCSDITGSLKRAVNALPDALEPYVVNNLMLPCAR